MDHATHAGTTSQPDPCHDRRLMALYYAWGCEDTGDRRLREATHHRVAALDFAEFAAAQAHGFHHDHATSLPPVQDQYARYVAALTPGTLLTDQATGDVIEVLAYDGHANQVEARTTHDAGHPDGTPTGHTFTTTPADLAGRRYHPTPTTTPHTAQR